MNEVSATTIQKDRLLAVLEDFHARVEKSAPVAKLIASWDRLVELRARDTGVSYFLRSKAGKIARPSGRADAKPDVTIAAEEATLTGIFSGEINPSRAHLDGELEAYGAPKDHLVLDAIVLLIWGA